MYNYLTDKVRRVQNQMSSNGQNKLDSLVDSILTRIMAKDGKKDTPTERNGRNEKKRMVGFLHKYLYEEYILTHSNEANNESLNGAFLLLAAELVFFVSNKSMTFDEL